MTCDEFRELHQPSVKFAELPLSTREQLFVHFDTCKPCELFIELLRPEDSDMSFDGKALAKSDAKALGIIP